MPRRNGSPTRTRPRNRQDKEIKELHKRLNAQDRRMARIEKRLKAATSREKARA